MVRALVRLEKIARVNKLLVLIRSFSALFLFGITCTLYEHQNYQHLSTYDRLRSKSSKWGREKITFDGNEMMMMMNIYVHVVRVHFNSGERKNGNAFVCCRTLPNSSHCIACAWALMGAEFYDFRCIASSTRSHHEMDKSSKSYTQNKSRNVATVNGLGVSDANCNVTQNFLRLLLRLRRPIIATHSKNNKTLRARIDMQVNQIQKIFSSIRFSLSLYTALRGACMHHSYYIFDLMSSYKKTRADTHTKYLRSLITHVPSPRNCCLWERLWPFFFSILSPHLPPHFESAYT